MSFNRGLVDYRYLYEKWTFFFLFKIKVIGNSVKEFGPKIGHFVLEKRQDYNTKHMGKMN